MIKVDLLKAKINHLNWRTRLLEYLEGKNSLSKEEVLSHEQCQLGKWIYAEGMQKYGHLNSMQLLELYHKNLHDAIRRVFELQEAKQFDKAKQEYQRMKELSELVIRQLDEMMQILQTI